MQDGARGGNVSTLIGVEEAEARPMNVDQAREPDVAMMREKPVVSVKDTAATRVLRALRPRPASEAVASDPRVDPPTEGVGLRERGTRLRKPTSRVSETTAGMVEVADGDGDGGWTALPMDGGGIGEAASSTDGTACDVDGYMWVHTPDA